MNQEREKAVRLLQTAQGQIKAVLKMLDEDRYCVDIANQISATRSLLKKANMNILNQHMEHCVVEAIEKGNSKAKIDEVLLLMDRLID